MSSTDHAPIAPPTIGRGLAPNARQWMHHRKLEQIADLVSISLPRGGRVVVVSDLHLAGTATPASSRATDELIEVLRTWTGPGAFVIAGDGFEQLHEPVATIDEILDAHRRWTEAVAAFARGTDRHVVVLSGNHDGNLAWDADVGRALRQRLGADHLGLELDLEFDTAEGTRTVHVVHCNQWDPYNACVDRRSPVDTPTGHHVVREILPRLDSATHPGGLLEGLDSLAEVPLVGEMVGSRLLYRRAGRHAWLLIVPVIVLALARLVREVVPDWTAPEATFETWLWRALLLSFGALAVAVLATTVAMVGVHRSLSREVGPGLGSHNDTARAHARRLVDDGAAGLVSGHTHHPELSPLGASGFYANSGCGVDVTGPRPARLRLPRAFTTVRRASRVELTGTDRLRVVLIAGDEPVPSPSLLERLVARPDMTTPRAPEVIATVPEGDGM
ncbi:hypothetical protein BH10ACT3_BH10ACT3_02030 [soil metagenome]